MSVYIPGMEMPERCYDCPACHGAECWANHCAYISDYRKPRPEWCPLVSVPKHGRLGDLDAAVEKLKRLREYHSDDSQSGVFIAHGISYCIEVLTGKEAPTIIPADHISDVNEMVTDKEGEG